MTRCLRCSAEKRRISRFLHHVARLARLDLSDDELAGYKNQLGLILEHAARVQSLDAEPQVENAHPLGLFNIFRDDVVLPSLDRDEVMASAPETAEGYFVVPPVMEGE
jgi:aspartyl-tRNA(Asn)/glutamyl-tRNA(Gln) amidotransferase subunit C